MNIRKIALIAGLFGLVLCFSSCKEKKGSDDVSSEELTIEEVHAKYKSVMNRRMPKSRNGKALRRRQNTDFDFLSEFTDEDWEELAEIIGEDDLEEFLEELYIWLCNCESEYDGLQNSSFGYGNRHGYDFDSEYDYDDYDDYSSDEYDEDDEYDSEDDDWDSYFGDYYEEDYDYDDDEKEVADAYSNYYGYSGNSGNGGNRYSFDDEDDYYGDDDESENDYYSGSSSYTEYEQPLNSSANSGNSGNNSTPSYILDSDEYMADFGNIALR